MNLLTSQLLKFRALYDLVWCYFAGVAHHLSLGLLYWGLA